MKLIILHPEKTLFNDDVESVMLPGVNGQFTILDRHAPLISVLRNGVIKYRSSHNDSEEAISINSGFVKVKKNKITVCID